MIWLRFAVILVILSLSGCATHTTGGPNDVSAPADWLAWQGKRRQSVAGTNGWATLVGLYWLHPGRNSAGGNPTNDVALPRNRAAGFVGDFVRTDRHVRFEAGSGIAAAVAGKAVSTLDLESDALLAPTKLQLGTLTIIVIERGERIGLRVRDPEAPARVNFQRLQYFPYDPAWRIEGRFEKASSGRKLFVQDVTGGTQEYVVPGWIVFTYNGSEQRLEVVEEPGEEDYFVIFRDQTAGKSTYPAGRFFYVAKPDATGRVVIDFNRAYNPPCAFTPYATCPLPPRQNWLPFAVEAGERVPPGHH
ncbi:MAG: hypothetical protein JWM99_3902 [Verrucomicrobiales bacterium]|nr:hypothetical protein [Verrucomicrobiales bacterium]